MSMLQYVWMSPIKPQIFVSSSCTTSREAETIQEKKRLLQRRGVVIMSKMKRFAEKISLEMGYGGEINSEVLQEANRVLKENRLPTYKCKQNKQRPTNG
jgi:hypothetical protein